MFQSFAMDGILNFFKEFRDRFSSPLFSSFVIAWLFINWQVPLYLFFYDFDKLKIDGYLSYHDMIIKNVTAHTGVWLPIIYACIYTFAFPLIRNLNIAANAWYKKWGNSLYFKISKESHIPYTKYIELKENYEKQTQWLSEVINSDSKNLEDSLRYQQESKDANARQLETIQDFDQKFNKQKEIYDQQYTDQHKDFTIKMRDLQENLNNTNSDLTDWKNSINPDFFKGRWILNKPGEINDLVYDNGNFCIPLENELLKAYQISFFFISPEYQYAHLILNKYDKMGDLISIPEYYRLTWANDRLLLSGSLNHDTKVSLSKVR